MRLSKVYVQAVKEFDQLRRDKLTLALAFVLPVFALVMYGFATRLEAKDIPIAILNYDSGKVSREFIDRIYASVQFVPARSIPGNAIAPLDRAEARATIVIPPDFSRNLKAGRPAPYQAIIDGSDVNNARVVKNALIYITRSYEQVSGLTHVQPLINAAVRLWYNPGRKESLYIVPGTMGLLLWIFPAILSSLALAREKEQGTVLQVYASSLTAKEFMAGKALAYTLIAVGEAVCLLFMAMIIFGLKLQAELTFFAICTILFSSAAVLFGLWAGSRANNQMAAIQIVANLGFLSTMLLSGIFYPLRNVVYPLSLLAYVVPAMYYVLVCRNEFVRGSSWWDLWYVPVFLLVCNGLLFLAITRIKMKLTG